MKQPSNAHAKAVRAPGPKYRRVHLNLMEQVRSGVFQVGSALPREEELARSLEVARSTVRRALAELESDGLIRRIPGKGTFVNSPHERRAQNRTRLFSLIVPFLREDPIRTLIAGVERAAAAVQCRVVVSTTENDVGRQEVLLREAAEANVAGVVLCPTAERGDARQVDVLRSRHVPIVFCSRRIPRVQAPLVTWPHVDVGHLCAEVLLEHGHRRIASLCDFEDVFTGTVVVGIRHTLKERGMDDSGHEFLCYGERERGHRTRDAIARVLTAILFREDRPTAIQCFNAFDAEQVYLLAADLGFRIPEDLSLIYFGSKERESALSQRLVCVGADQLEIGGLACRLLDDMDAGKVALDSNHTHEVPLVLLPGESLAPPPRGACT